MSKFLYEMAADELLKVQEEIHYADKYSENERKEKIRLEIYRRLLIGEQFEKIVRQELLRRSSPPIILCKDCPNLSIEKDK